MAKDQRMRRREVSIFQDELLLSIIVKLPLQNIFQLRCVCKAWRTLLTDDKFLEYLFREFIQAPMYTVCLEDGFAAYSIETKRWHRWPSALYSRYFSRYIVYADIGDWLLVEHESVKDDNRFQRLCLANPKARSQRTLPRLSKEPSWDPSALGTDEFAVGLIASKDSKSCEVFIAGTENADKPGIGSHWLHKVYLSDSGLDSWEAIWPWKEEFTEEIRSITFYDGALHCIMDILDEDCEFYISRRVHRYDERRSRWQELSAQISAELCFLNLFKWQGHLMLIGGRNGGLQDDQRLVSVHIWQLDKENQFWVEKMRMPDHILNHFSPPTDESYNYLDRLRFTLEICGHCICLSKSLTMYIPEDMPLDSSEDMGSEHDFRHVMCNLSTRSWWEVPEPSCSYHQSGFSLLIPKSGFEKL